MTGFDIVLAIGIIWLIVLFVIIKHEGRPIDMEDWLGAFLLSMLGTILVCLCIAMLIAIGYGLYIADWHSFFHNKIV